SRRGNAERRRVGHGNDRPCAAKARARDGRDAQLRRLGATARRTDDESDGRNRQTGLRASPDFKSRYFNAHVAVMRASSVLVPRSIGTDISALAKRGEA